MPQVVGQSSATKILQPGYPQKERDENGLWRLVYEYVVRRDSESTEAPAHNSSPPEPEASDVRFSALVCKGVSVRPGGSYNVVMAVNYRDPQAPGLSPRGDGDIAKSTRTTFVQEAIHNRDGTINSALATYLGLTDSELDVKSSEDGKQVVVVPHVTYVRTEYHADSDIMFDDDTALSTVGERTDAPGPPGLTLNSTSHDDWRHMIRDIREAGDDLIEVTDEYEHNPLGWDTDLTLT